MAVIKLAIDMGSSLTKIYQAGIGIVLSEPSAVAVTTSTGEVKAVGIEAKRLVGKTAENTTIMFPVFEGEVVNEKLAAVMLANFLDKLEARGSFKKVEALFSVPCGADDFIIEKLRRVCALVGIKKANFAIAPILSALGQNLPLNEFSPCFVIDIGGGVTDIAAFSLDGIIAGVSMNLGGGNIDAHLIDHIADTMSLKIGLLTSERIKKGVGSFLANDMTGGVINGRDIISGRPRSANVTAERVLEPLKIYIDKILEYTENVLSKLPAEVSAEIRDTGIYLSGGTAKIAGLKEYISKRLKINVSLADEPDLAVAQGCGAALASKEILNSIKIKVM